MKEKKISYKDSIQEIEEILAKIEAKEIDLDQLTEHIKRAVELLALCKHKLTTSEKEVYELLKNIEEK
ncbi:MAG: exodeoxyribonuclease VII small subunit [Bacteroidales bacterium]|nr:exodeoxyribonuclease VII small subunit [Bacteroidales bacterium]NLK81399.1 exodeoxyribonuclease VII small subunit [Bacteroidales bacterium]